MKHYFRPGREDFRQAIMRAMPKMLGKPPPKPEKEKMRRILERVTPKTCKRDRARLLQILATL
jgi:hypothetical protein